MGAAKNAKMTTNHTMNKEPRWALDKEIAHNWGARLCMRCTDKNHFARDWKTGHKHTYEMIGLEAKRPYKEGGSEGEEEARSGCYRWGRLCDRLRVWWVWERIVSGRSRHQSLNGVQEAGRQAWKQYGMQNIERETFNVKALFNGKAFSQALTDLGFSAYRMVYG